MAVAHVAEQERDAGPPARDLFAGLVPAAVGFAAAVLLLTVGALLAGPPLVRDHANGATLALLGMGVPVQWSALSGRAVGTIGVGDHPAVLIATLVVASATFGIGWFASRRHPRRGLWSLVAPSAAWFSGICTLAALVITLGRPLEVAGASVHVALSVPLTLVISAVWGVVGMSAGAFLARRVRPTHAVDTASPWLFKGPGAAIVATAVTIIGVSACGGGPGSAITAAARTEQQAAPSTTTSTTLAPTTTTAPAPATAAATRTTSARAARAPSKPATTSTSPNKPAAVATGFAPAVPGVYRYDTSGSTSSLLGKQAFSAVSTLTVDPPSGTKQHSVRELKSSNGDGFTIDQILDYRPEGVTVVRQRLVLTQRGDRTVRTLNAAPPTLVIPLGLGVGTHRVLDLTGVGLVGHEVVDILQAVTVTVAGQPVSGILVRTVLNVSGGVSGTIQLDQWWSPSARVPMKEQLTATMKSGLASVKTTYDATIQKLTP